MTKRHKAEETRDDLQNGYFLLQARDGFRFGIDAVLLADFAVRGMLCAIRGDLSFSEKKDTVQILDLGCGNGILPLLLAARLRNATESSKADKSQPTTAQNFSLTKSKISWHVTGLEIQAEAADLAKRNVQENALENQITILEGDLREAPSLFEEASFDFVLSNPPYLLPEQGKISPNKALALARHEIACTFADVAGAAARTLTENGRFFLIHRSTREAEILQTLQAHDLCPIRLRRIQPFANSEANLFLVEAAPGKNDALVTEKALIIYREPGVYTEEVRRIYYDAECYFAANSIYRRSTCPES